MKPLQHHPQSSPDRPTQITQGKKKKRVVFFVAVLVALGLLGWLLNNMRRLELARDRPLDAILVLGGSIKREIYAAKLAKQYPDVPILISQGADPPCVWLIFDRANAPMQEVWLERCATSTFDNYQFTCPLLQQWGAKHVKIITSPTHLPRAKWLGQIILGSHGMWVEMDLVEEQGVPGNREFWGKTALDVTRSLAWAGISQVHSPQCHDVQPLTAVDMDRWEREGFTCEHQGNLPDTEK